MHNAPHHYQQTIMPTKKVIQVPSGIVSNISTAIETLSNCVPTEAQNHEKKDETFENMVSC
jgi:hypothetical protein